jgi:cytochrome b subunit of formate dehydrogenase
MKTIYSPIDRLTHLIHHNLIWLVIGSYGLAMIFPTLGLTLRGIEFSSVQASNTSSLVIFTFVDACSVVI